MSSKGRVGGVLLALVGASSCGETGQERLEVALSAHGTAQHSIEVDGATFTLTRAEVALGPFYFCASESADSELCEAALAELTQGVTIDGLRAEPQALPPLAGTSGDIHSVIYDYGIAWLLTESAPEALTLLGHSAVLEGNVTRGDKSLRFVAAVDVLPRVAGAHVVNGQRTEHVLGEGDELTLSVNPTFWLRPINVDALFELDSAGTGEVVIERGSQAYEAILQSMQNRAPVQFEW
jgi:hypothetical protein